MELFTGIVVVICLSWIIFRRPIVSIYLLLFIVAFFPEVGERFQRLHHSIFYGKDFLKAGGFTTVDFIVLFTFIAVALPNFMRHSHAVSRMYKPFIIFFVWLIVPFFAGVIYGQQEIFSYFRNILLGFFLYYIIINKISANSMHRIYLTWSFLIIFSLKGLVVLVQFLYGYGLNISRGYIPNVWEGALLLGFSLVALTCFSLFIYNRKYSKIKKIFLTFSIFVCSIVILYSTKRSVIALTTIAIIAIIISTRNIAIIKKSIFYFSIFFIISLLIVSKVPILLHNLENVQRYVYSINILSQEQVEVGDTDVKVEGFYAYLKFALLNPKIFVVGIRATDPSYLDKLRLQHGVAHHGIIRPLVDFGVPGLIFLYSIFFIFIKYAVLNFKHLSSTDKGSVAGMLSFLIFLFLNKIIIGAPFYGTFKGSFIVFFAMGMIHVHIAHSKKEAALFTENYKSAFV